MTEEKVLYKEAKMREYYNEIKDKFQKIIKYERFTTFFVFISIFVFGGFLASFTIDETRPVYSVSLKRFLVFFWAIIALILGILYMYYQKKLKNLSEKNYNRMFYYAFSAYENIEKYLKINDLDLLKKAAAYLQKTIFYKIKYKIDDAFDIPGLKEEWLIRIDDILTINQKQVVPRLMRGIEIGKLKPIVGNIAQFFYCQIEEDTELQRKLSKDSSKHLKQLERLKEEKILDLKNFTDISFFSRNPVKRMISFSLTIGIVYVLIFIVYWIVYSKPIQFSEAIIIGLLGTSIIGGGALANICKK